jgi:mitochondrial fission protein ELM1
MAEAGPGGKTIWVLADDRPGNASQCIGVAEALGMPFIVKNITYGPLAALPNALLGASLAGLTPESRRAIAAPWPDIVIAAGRRTAPVARAIKRVGGGRPLLVQIMDPGLGGRDDFDLIAVPRHDGNPPALPSVLPITGAPHRVTAEKLKHEADIWLARWSALPAPRIGLIVGGSTRRRAFAPAMARELGERASALAAGRDGSLLITTSRRTGDAANDLLAAITAPSSIFRWGEEGENPYLGILGASDVLIVTGDSVSMCSEAAAGTQALYLYAPPGLVTAKHAAFHDSLYRQGYARPLGPVVEYWTHPTLNAAADVAAAIRQRLGAPALPSLSPLAEAPKL